MARRSWAARIALWSGVSLLSLGYAGCSASSVTPVPAAPVSVPATITPSGTTSLTTPAVNPCTLVTAAQVRAALGGTIAASQLDLTTTDVPTCLWAAKGSTIGAGTLRVAVTGTKGTVATFTTMQKSFTGAKDLSGVGDQAFTVDPIGQVILFRNGTTVTVAASGFVLNGADPPRAAVQSALTSVAKSAAANL